MAWRSLVKRLGMMDSLLRACFAPQAAKMADSSGLSAEEAASHANEACRERIVQAHAAQCAKRLAASACEALSQILGGRASAHPGAQAAGEHSRPSNARTEGLSSLEASPGLEAADEHLDKLGQVGSQAGSVDAGDESWLDEEAQLQSSQDHSTYAGEGNLQLTDDSRPSSVRGGVSEQQELQQHSLLDFDEGPDAAMAGAVLPRAAQMDFQVPAPEESAHQQLPAYFGGADEDSMALEGLLENASGNTSIDITHSLEPEDEHANSAAAHPDERLPSFFQPDEGTGLLEALELEPEVCQHSDKPATRMLQQEPGKASQASGESDYQSASPGTEENAPQTEPHLEQSSTEGGYAYGASAAATGHCAASQASNLSVILRPSTPAAAQEHRHPQLSSQPTHSEATPEDQGAADGLQKAVLCVGRTASLRAELAAFSAALKQAQAGEQAKRRAIVRYEWMHEAILGPAGVLGPPVLLSQLVCSPLKRSPEMSCITTACNVAEPPSCVLRSSGKVSFVTGEC